MLYFGTFMWYNSNIIIVFIFLIWMMMLLVVVCFHFIFNSVNDFALKCDIHAHIFGYIFLMDIALFYPKVSSWILLCVLLPYKFIMIDFTWRFVIISETRKQTIILHVTYRWLTPAMHDGFTRIICWKFAHAMRRSYLR